MLEMRPFTSLPMDCAPIATAEIMRSPICSPTIDPLGRQANPPDKTIQESHLIAGPQQPIELQAATIGHRAQANELAGLQSFVQGAKGDERF
mmetsp:Transcript_26457/g.74075  ORF Transcript_26457/g.74075 Transcript_26457/m.74075 type:complete len:92 (-) Transcript_26457:147-422(-)